MAQKVTVSLVDDLSGAQADETVSFGLDGKSYEIDLSSKNATSCARRLTDYVTAARKPVAGASRALLRRPAPRDRP